MTVKNSVEIFLSAGQQTTLSEQRRDERRRRKVAAAFDQATPQNVAFEKGRRQRKKGETLEETVPQSTRRNDAEKVIDAHFRARILQVPKTTFLFGRQFGNVDGGVGVEKENDQEFFGVVDAVKNFNDARQEIRRFFEQRSNKLGDVSIKLHRHLVIKTSYLTDSKEH